MYVIDSSFTSARMPDERLKSHKHGTERGEDEVVNMHCNIYNVEGETLALEQGFFRIGKFAVREVDKSF